KKMPLATAVLKHLVDNPRGYYKLAFSPNGKLLANSLDKEVRVIDAVTGKHLWFFKGFPDEIHALLFTPDNKMVVTGCRDKSIKLWDVATGKEHKILTKSESTFGGMKWALGGKAVAVSGGGSFENKGIVLVDMATGESKSLIPNAASFAVSAD